MAHAEAAANERYMLLTTTDGEMNREVSTANAAGMTAGIPPRHGHLPLARIRRPVPVWLGACVLALLTMLAGNAAAAPYEIEIDKGNRQLIVRSGDEVLKVFSVAVGRGGAGDKQRTGDNKTPVGTYRVVGFNPSNRFDYFVRLNYPNVKDAFYGLRNEVITRDEFDRIVTALRGGRLPPQNTALGGAIGIHGIGEQTPTKLRIHDRMDWTEGCIALRNEQVRELRHYLGIGTRVVIRE